MSYIEKGSYVLPIAKANLLSIERDLTVKTTDYFGHAQKLKLYSIEGIMVKVPRIYGFCKYGPADENRLLDGAPLGGGDIGDTPTYTLQDHQKTCLNYILPNNFNDKFIKFGVGGAILNLACGRGKTHTGMAFLFEKGRRTLIIGPSNVCVSQWIKQLRKAFPFLTVGEYHGGNTLPSTDIVAATIHGVTIHRMGAHSKGPAQMTESKVFNEWLATFGTTLYDEIHLYGSKEFSVIFDLVSSNYQLGLSATPDRTDFMELLYSYKVGPIIDCHITLGIAPPKFKVTVYPISPPKSTRLLVATGINQSYPASVKALTMSPSRVDVLIPLLRGQLAIPDENILIACNYIEEVDFLYGQLMGKLSDPNLPGVPISGCPIGTVYMDMDSNSIATWSDVARIIICTYKKGGMAFDPVRFTTEVVWSTTRAMLPQFKGRIERFRDGNDEWNERPRTVFDFIDQHTVASSQYYCDAKVNDRIVPGRRSVYINAGCMIVLAKNKKAMKSMEEDVKNEFKSMGL